jgi:universal stress protein E
MDATASSTLPRPDTPMSHALHREGGRAVNPIRNILVIVDPTAKEHPSVAKGARLAEALGAHLELFVCETQAAREARLTARLRDRSSGEPPPDIKTMLERLAQPLRERGLDVTTETECSDPLHLALADRTKRTTADLVIKDTHHHSLAKRTFLTNTDWHLIRTCPVPLLLTKATPWSAELRLVAAVDPGHANDKPAALDERILEYAAALSKQLGGDMHVIHAYVPTAILASAGPGNPPMVVTAPAEELASEEQEKRDRVLDLVGPFAVGVANVHVELGSPLEVLPRLAGALQADIVAMGAISRSALRRVLIGSTAEDVLDRLPCDALIIKPPDFASVLPF